MYKKIFFVGIKGVGLTSLVLVANDSGIQVKGSDVESEFITDEILQRNSISYVHSFDENEISDFVGETDQKEVLVITTSAHGGFDNPQVKWAIEKGIKVLTHGQAVGEFMRGEIFGRSFKGISIAGSHGKTTISGMLATVMSELGLDPSYVVGTSELFPLGNPGHFGQGEYFIAEADEYISELQYDRKPKLLYQFPAIQIINNIDFDHPDFYESIDQVEKVFADFMKQVTLGGLIIVNGDDKRILSILKDLKDTKVITYGIGSENDYSLGDYKENGRSIDFQVVKKDESKYEYAINIPGVHNTLNALSIIALCEQIGIDSERIKRALGVFTGTKRRFEIVGSMHNGAVVIDDYAHHPEEITKTLSAARLAYPNKKIFCIFQPHTLSRTSALLDDFSYSFAGVEQLVLLPVFITKRETEINTDQPDILSRFQKDNPTAVLLEDRSSVVEYVLGQTGSDFIVMTMGAGDVYTLGKQLINK